MVVSVLTKEAVPELAGFPENEAASLTGPLMITFAEALGPVYEPVPDPAQPAKVYIPNWAWQ